MQSHSSYMHTFYFTFLFMVTHFAATVARSCSFNRASRVSILVKGFCGFSSQASCSLLHVDTHLVRLRSIKPCAARLCLCPEIWVDAGYTLYVHVYMLLVHTCISTMHSPTCILHASCLHILIFGTLSPFLTCGLSTTGPVHVIGSPFLVQYSVVVERAANGKKYSNLYWFL